jgi:4-hydroxy-tetrahydrodipicolinate reductase
MTPIRLAIAGCTGRTGATILRLAATDPRFTIVAALSRPDDPQLGGDAGQAVGQSALGLPISADCRQPCDVLIEFTLPDGCRQWADWCAAHGVALVSGTTGLTEPHHAALRHAALRVPVLWAPNMSIGVNLLLKLVKQAAAQLHDWDIEICETHHRHKVDAPSGTANALLQAICQARGSDPDQTVVHGRHGQCGPRRPGEIGIHALRMGEHIGHHDVTFASSSESLRLAHEAHSRETFASGALHAARWIAGRTPGLYAMADVLAETAP